MVTMVVGGLGTILVSTRLYRILPSILIILISCSIANAITYEIIMLIIILGLVYAAAGIHNAQVDNDFKLPKSSNLYSKGFIILGLLVSFQNKILFYTALIWILAGIIYNTISRKILFGDSTVIAFTHFTLPSISSSLLLGFESKFTILLAVYFFVTFWFFIPSKNNKDKISDTKRGYKTLNTLYKIGNYLSLFFMFGFYAMVVIGKFIFKLPNTYYLLIIPSVIAGIYAIHLFLKKKDKLAIVVNRLCLLLFLTGFVYASGNNTLIVMLSFGILFSYLLFSIISFNVKILDRGVLNE